MSRGSTPYGALGRGALAYGSSRRGVGSLVWPPPYQAYWTYAYDCRFNSNWLTLTGASVDIWSSRLTTRNMPGSGSTRPTVAVGTGMYFDDDVGEADFLINTQLAISPPYSIFALTKRTSQNNITIGRPDNGTAGSFLVRYDGAKYRHRAEEVEDFGVTATGFDLNEWQAEGVVCDGSTTDFYANGVYQAQDASPSGNDFYLQRFGAWSGDTYNDFNMALVLVSTTDALTQTEGGRLCEWMERTHALA